MPSLHTITPMTTRTVRFKQVDVFTTVPFKGNPLAVVFDADDLSTESMQAIARWTNLSETTFLLRPTDPAADYRVRIFTTSRELPFAGHPTLGTAHALLESGYAPKHTGRLVQQCGVGLVPIVAREEGAWAFAAPPARIRSLNDAQQQQLAAAFGSDVIDFTAPPCAVDNGVPWLVTRVNSAANCLALKPNRDAMTALMAASGTLGLAVYGPYRDAAPATFELRALLFGEENTEDPVTGSANAALACLLTTQNRRPGPSFTVRQGTAIGRDGRISIAYDDTTGQAQTWIGGHTVTIVDGSIRL
ncbi:phenazine biosynthesis PhzC/PhzF protein [Caballeronia humi]|uniref:Phenazine biosynthesis PhzC/PhzF protein n=2 Tax=Caballeronia humi TaxID=326474 RepID=A0A158HHK4_9BURK|nr:phenazine biosynthesis PhzC/PhzF protein [Caballeronia humi]